LPQPQWGLQNESKCFVWSLLLAPPLATAVLITSLCAERPGLLFLANALDSIHAGLATDVDVRELLEDLSEEIAHSSDKWPKALDRVCRGKAKAPSLRRPSGYVRSTGKSGKAIHEAPEWTSVISMTQWVEHHLDKVKPSAKRLPKFPAGRDPAFENQFKNLTAKFGWQVEPTHAGGAWQGRPAADGANCWVTCTDLDPPPTTAPVSSPKKSARRVAESLGIKPTSPFESYVRYTIDAAQVRAVPMADARRPTFADLGNDWFRVRASSTRAVHYAEHNWGSTVHISALRAGGKDDVGRPERVVTSIPVKAPFIRGIEWLPAWPSDSRFTSPPHTEFEAKLLGSRKAPEIKDAVIRLWQKPSKKKSK
jgi:hypothetical protein